MPSLAKILLPVDFSDRCITAARHAAQIARRFDSEITLLHALAPLSTSGQTAGEPGSEPIPAEVLTARSSHVERHLHKCLEGELEDLRVVRVLAEGDPASSIIEHAHSGNFDLIMMPTRGYGPFRRLLLGSVTAKVLNGADCPVWTSTHQETSPSTDVAAVDHILCAVDLGPQSVAVLTWASSLAAELKARLSLVHVVPLDPRTTGYYFSPEWRGYLIQAAETDIAKLQDTAGASAEVHLAAGDIREAVHLTADTVKANLLIIGRSAVPGSSGRLPSNAYAIIRDSPCPVISV